MLAFIWRLQLSRDRPCRSFAYEAAVWNWMILIIILIIIRQVVAHEPFPQSPLRQPLQSSPKHPAQPQRWELPPYQRRFRPLPQRGFATAAPWQPVLRRGVLDVENWEADARAYQIKVAGVCIRNICEANAGKKRRFWSLSKKMGVRGYLTERITEREEWDHSGT